MALTAAEMSLLDEPIQHDPKPDTTARDNLGAAVGGNADQYAEDLSLSRETGFDPETVSQNRDEVRKHKYLTGDDLKRLDDAPKTTEWFKNQDNARVAYDDLDKLIEYERTSNRSWYELDSRFAKNFGESMMLGWSKVYNQSALAIASEADIEDVGLSEFLSGDPLSAGAKIIGKAAHRAYLSDEEREARRKRLEELQQHHIEEIERKDALIAGLTPEQMTVMEEGLRGGMQMVSDMLPGLTITALSRGRINPTLGYLTAKTGLESYGEARKEGRDHQTALAYGGIDAVLEAATERLPMKRLEKIIGEIGGKGGVKSSIKRWLVEEAATEQLATLTQSLNAYAFELDEELANAKTAGEAMEIQGRRQAVTFLSTLSGGGSLSGTLATADWALNRKQRAFEKAMYKGAKRAGSEHEQDRLDELVWLAQNSKLNERSKEAFADFLKKVPRDENIYISASAIEEMEDAPEYLVAQLDGSTGTVVMGMGQFMTEFATDEAKMALLRPHIKTKENLQTQTELEEDNDSEYIKTLLAKANAAEETKNESDRIFDLVRDQIVATGRQSEAFARHSAQLNPALVATKYEELKRQGATNDDGSEITVAQLYEDMGLRIAGATLRPPPATDFLDQENAPPLIKGLSLLPTADIETLRAAAFQSPDGDVHKNTQLLDFLAKRAGYKNSAEYNQALKEQDAAYDLLLESPEQLMLLASDPDMAALLNTGPAYKTIALAITNRRGLRLLRDNKEVKQIEDALSDATPDELIEIIADEFAPDPQRTGVRLVGGTDTNILRQVGNPAISARQNFQGIVLADVVTDDAGTVYDVTEEAQDLWNQQRTRTKMAEQLRECMA